MRNNCETIRERVGPWLDGELAASDAEATRLHVEDCAVCREERRQLDRLHSTLHTVLKADASKLAPDLFWRGVEQRIARKNSWYDEVGDWIRGTFTAPRLAWAVPAVIVLVLAAWSIDSLIPGAKIGTRRDNFATVESIDAYGRNVALLHEGETNTTVIWLYQPQESENESSTETTETKPSF
jgi:predicted anti-sigma-YlaC factor YlaD